jgi:hypothetical protein
MCRVVNRRGYINRDSHVKSRDDCGTHHTLDMFERKENCTKISAIEKTIQERRKKTTTIV